MKCIRIVIHGKVQGVFYRATAKKVADRLNLTGWIKNTKEGYVEAIISGDEDHLQEFIVWCKQGPEKALVKDVIITKKKEMVLNNFEIIRG